MLHEVDGYKLLAWLFLDRMLLAVGKYGKRPGAECELLCKLSGIANAIVCAYLNRQYESHYQSYI